MSIAPGTRLGVYQVAERIGAGGMGEVYRARDTKLHRDVAIKVLLEAVAHDSDRLRRFEREAQTLAGLNHPHIAQVHGFEESDTVSALVMELVDGPTLADRVAQGPIPLAEALAIATQIAGALEAAHEHGVVHRDLKPANIKVRDDGAVKVLDFGLAKAFDPVSASSASASVSPTLSLHATQAGVVLGTAAYMAPEQARGRRVDKRADIWAFGVVLFEMLTGRRPFAGDDDVIATVASVIKDPPAFAALPPETPDAVRRLLRRCLEKDPANRLADIADARLEIAEALAAKPDIPAAPATGRSRAVVWQAVAAVLAIVAALGWWNGLRDRRSTPSTQAPSFRVDVDLGPDVSPDSMGPAAILSPTGARVVFVSKSQDDKTHLSTKLLDEPKATVLPGTEGAYGPFFSADGQWVGFFAGGKLKKMRIDGTQIVTLCEASAGRGASWSDDGTFIVAALDNQGGLARIAAEGGTPVPLTKFSGEERTHRWPHVLPGHQAVLFTATVASGNFIDSRIGVAAITDSQSAPSDHTILPADAVMYPRYIANGHLMFVKKNGLYAVSFDRSRLRIVGTPVQVLDDVSNDTSFGTAQIAVSESGTLLYHRGGSLGMRSIQWLHGDGRVEPLLPEAAMYIYPRVASDGDRVAFTNADESNSDIWVYNTRTRTKTRLTSGPGQKSYPTWSPDGRYLVFSTPGTLFWVPADAARPPQVLMRGGGTIAPSAFSPDGKTLAFVERSAGGQWSLRTVPIRTVPNGLDAGAPEPFVDVSSAATAAFSPDGRWLAYTSSESGSFEVYVRGFPDNGTKRLVSSGGGMMPMWSRNGKDIFYRTQDQRLMIASYRAKDGSFIADPPRPWSTQRLANIGMTGNVDLAPDGTRFVVLMPAEAAESRETRGHYTLVTNFFDAVGRRLAASPK